VLADDNYIANPSGAQCQGCVRLQSIMPTFRGVVGEEPDLITEYIKHLSEQDWIR